MWMEKKCCNIHKIPNLAVWIATHNNNMQIVITACCLGFFYHWGWSIIKNCVINIIDVDIATDAASLRYVTLLY